MNSNKNARPSARVSNKKQTQQQQGHQTQSKKRSRRRNSCRNRAQQSDTKAAPETLSAPHPHLRSAPESASPPSHSSSSSLSSSLSSSSSSTAPSYSSTTPSSSSSSSPSSSRPNSRNASPQRNAELTIQPPRRQPPGLPFTAGFPGHHDPTPVRCTCPLKVCIPRQVAKLDLRVHLPLACFLGHRAWQEYLPAVCLTPWERHCNRYPNESHRARGYISTSPASPLRPPKVFAMDCEMVKTDGGNLELARMTIIESTTPWVGSLPLSGSGYRVVCDTLVKPARPVVDYVTQYSGITAELLRTGNPVSFVQAQALFCFIVKSHDYLVGHSLETDLHAVKATHPMVIDTAVSLGQCSGLGFTWKKPSLRRLVQQVTGRNIQCHASGHDSEEDAAGALSVARWHFVNLLWSAYQKRIRQQSHGDK